jgi:FTR1 family protein
MLEALVITLREGLEAALVVGIVFAYLARTGRSAWRRYVWFGLIAALFTSVGGAALFQVLGIDPENELYEGTIMFVAAAFVTTMIVWMWRTGRTLRAELEQKMEQTLAERDDNNARAGWGLAAFTFFMVFREGIEAVLFLTALSATIGANPLNNVIGGAVGLILAALFGALIAKGAVRVNLKRFFSVTSLVLLILVVKLIANGLHEFLEIKLLPSTPELMSIIGLLTRETTSLFILIALIALPALLVLWDTWRTPRPALIEGESAPDHRKRLAQFQNARRWAMSASLTALLISTMLGSSLATAASRDAELTMTEMPAHNDAVHIPVAEVSDGEMHKYFYSHNGIGIRFFVIRRNDGSIATALDACGICPAKGYRRDGEQVMCRNCDAPINLDTIGEPGGCNPIPLASEIVGQDVVVTLADLTANEGKFK